MKKNAIRKFSAVEPEGPKHLYLSGSVTDIIILTTKIVISEKTNCCLAQWWLSGTFRPDQARYSHDNPNAAVTTT